MKLVSVSNQGSLVFEIERFVQGIEITNIKEDSTIKVDLVDDNLQDVNVFPQMTIAQMHTIMQELDDNRIVGVYTTATSHFDMVRVLFSKGGVLPFNESKKYKVTLGALNNRAIIVNAIDNERVAAPVSRIRIEKAIIKETQPQVDVNFSGVSQIFFPDRDVFDKITYLKPFSIGGQSQTRKIELAKEQYASNLTKSGLMNVLEGVNSFSQYDGEIWDVRKLTNVTAHFEAEKDLFYYKIYNA